jgi:hypothetical protein
LERSAEVPELRPRGGASRTPHDKPFDIEAADEIQFSIVIGMENVLHVVTSQCSVPLMPLYESTP